MLAAEQSLAEAIAPPTSKLANANQGLPSLTLESLAPVAHYSFDQRPNGGFKNQAKPDEPLASAGSETTTVPGKVGKAIKLTGDHAVTTKVGNFRRQDPFTISVWIKPATMPSEQWYCIVRVPGQMPPAAVMKCCSNQARSNGR